MARPCILRKVHSKRNADSPPKKRMASQSMCFRCMQSKMQESILSEINSAHEKERPDNESPEESIINRETTYSLRNVMYRREWSHNKVILEIL
jgi:hypothetical protein